MLGGEGPGGAGAHAAVHRQAPDRTLTGPDPTEARWNQTFTFYRENNVQWDQMNLRHFTYLNYGNTFNLKLESESGNEGIELISLYIFMTLIHDPSHQGTSVNIFCMFK